MANHIIWLGKPLMIESPAPTARRIKLDNLLSRPRILSSRIEASLYMRKRLQHRSHKFLSMLGDAVRQNRIDLCISQEELADRCGMHRTYITDVESGYRNVSMLTLLKLADGLEMEAWQLLRLAVA